MVRKLFISISFLIIPPVITPLIDKIQAILKIQINPSTCGETTLMIQVPFLKKIILKKNKWQYVE